MKKQVLNAGSVELLDWMGGDKAIVRGGRICYQSQGSELADINLVKALVKNNHTSALEHAVFTFKVKAPIFVFRQWHRHRIGWSYNEKSLRYCEASPEFYIPQVLFEVNEDFILKSYESSYTDYLTLVNCGFPKEQARAVLPLGIYTEMVCTCNGASLLHFEELRTSKHAQKEIQDYAWALLDCVKEVAPIYGEALETRLGRY